MTLLALYLLLALGVSFFCSLAEATLLSMRPSYVATRKREGKPGGDLLARLEADLDRPLAAILTANTIAHTVGAAGVGAQTAIVFGDAYVGAASAVLTLLVLVLSEIIPKTLGATRWRALAPAMGRLVSWLTTALFPIVVLSERLTRLFSRGSDREGRVSRDEMRAMAALGEEEGALAPRESRVILNVLKLARLSVRDIMTPRPVVFSADRSMTIRDFFASHADEPFSRIPVWDGSPDAVTGYVLKDDLLAARGADEFERTLGEFARTIPVVPDALSASALFDRIIRERTHIALVVDEYGSLQGLVTQEDVLETLIGLEIVDEFDAVENMRALARERWRDRMTAIGVDPDSMPETPAP